MFLLENNTCNQIIEAVLYIKYRTIVVVFVAFVALFNTICIFRSILIDSAAGIK